MARITFDQRTLNQFSLYIELEIFGHPVTEQILRERVVNPIRLKVRNEVKRHYEGMLEAVTELLRNPPLHNIYDSAESQTQSVSMSTPHLGTVDFDTPPWSNFSTKHRVGLDRKYIRRHPRSEVFWYKTGALAEVFNQTVDIKTPTTAYLKKKADIKRLGDDRFSVAFTINLPKLHPVLDVMLRQSFANAEEVDDNQLPKSTSRFNFSRILYPEHQRPLLRSAAAALGRLMVEELESKRF